MWRLCTHRRSLYVGEKELRPEYGKLGRSFCCVLSRDYVCLVLLRKYECGGDEIFVVR